MSSVSTTLQKDWTKKLTLLKSNFISWQQCAKEWKKKKNTVAGGKSEGGKKKERVGAGGGVGG